MDRNFYIQHQQLDPQNPKTPPNCNQVIMEHFKQPQNYQLNHNSQVKLKSGSETLAKEENFAYQTQGHSNPSKDNDLILFESSRDDDLMKITDTNFN